MRILIPHPTIKPHHVRHAAAGLTVSGGVAEVFAPFHIGTLLFVIAGCIAIYEPHLVHEVELAMEEDV